MEEKILIKSEKYDIKKIIKLIFVVGIIGIIIPTLFTITLIIEHAVSYINHEHDALCRNRCRLTLQTAPLEYAFNEMGFLAFNIMGIIAICTLISFLIYAITYGYELIITNNRISGKVHLIKKVDLPIDSISAIAIINVLKGICVSTSSGRIYFLFIKNSEEIYKIINKLLSERQSKNIDSSIKNINNSDGTEQIKKYKELLDTRIINQEEFDKKKKELLNL